MIRGRSVTRISCAAIVVLAIATLGGCGSDASDVPRGWSRLSIKRAFGRHLDARPIAYIGGRFIAEGQRHISRREQEDGNYGAPLLWSSGDAQTWEPIDVSGLPRSATCGWCGIGGPRLHSGPSPAVVADGFGNARVRVEGSPRVAPHAPFFGLSLPRSGGHAEWIPGIRPSRTDGRTTDNQRIHVARRRDVAANLGSASAADERSFRWRSLPR